MPVGILMFHQLNFIALQADILSFNSALALLPWRQGQTPRLCDTRKVWSFDYVLQREIGDKDGE
jgi:hypothetical protein